MRGYAVLESVLLCLKLLRRFVCTAYGAVREQPNGVRWQTREPIPPPLSTSHLGCWTPLVIPTYRQAASLQWPFPTFIFVTNFGYGIETLFSFYLLYIKEGLDTKDRTR